MVLIIDDEQDIREVIRLKLEASGFDVREAVNGKEGIEMAKTAKPDIILLDVVMPVMDGGEALLKLQTDPETRRIKIFMFTGKGDPRPQTISVDKKFAQESGAVDFLRKEIDLNNLVRKLNDVWQQIVRSHKQRPSQN